MASASYLVSSFLGGELSAFAQGRVDKPDYKISLATCLNAFPAEIGPWCPRPGTAFAGATKGGKPGRTISWAFEQVAPVTLEFTDGNLCFRGGVAWLVTNDAKVISGISTANPAVVSGAPNWPTGTRVIFGVLGVSCPLLQNRQFLWTNVSSSSGSLTDALTGATIDGSTLGVGSLAATATISRIQDVATPYIAGAWSSLRMVQAETTGILLNGSFAPQALTVTTLPGTGVAAQFALAAATFDDGPYLDPFTNGVQATPNQKTGIVQITLSFPAYVATTSYRTGDFVTQNSVNYESLIDQNIGNNPDFTQVTNNTTAAGNATLHFAATTNIVAGMSVTDDTVSVIPANTTVLSKTSNTVVMSANATGGGVGSGDTIHFHSPTQWAPVSAGAAINPPPGQPNGVGRGFLGTDIGRLVRLLSEPQLWLAGSSYSLGDVVTYNPTGVPGTGTYWESQGNGNQGFIPGADLTHWLLVAPGAALPSVGDFTSPVAASGPAQWAWGKIVALLNFISGAVSGVAQIGTMTGNGGLAAAFNGSTSQNLAASAQATVGPIAPVIGNNFLNSFVGQNYSGTVATAYAIDHATIYPSSDIGFGELFVSGSGGPFVQAAWNISFFLYGKATAPASYNDGTILGTVTIGAGGIFPQGVSGIGTEPITIDSSDKITAYPYVWTAMETNLNVISIGGISGSARITLYNYIAQVQLFSAVGTGTGGGCNVELLGPPLLYTAPIITWRLGAFSDTTGWPTCGCYAGGRLWLAGAINNRFDACYADGIDGGEVNFAPTDQYGNVTPAHAITETFDDDGTNPIFSMKPVIQNTNLRGIVMGSQQREWFVFPPTAGGFGPTNIDSVPATHVGSANVLPVQTEHTIIFVQRYSVKLMEYFSDVFSGKYTAPNLADKAQHITRAGIAELAYTYAATPIVWGRCGDGTWFGVTYKRDTLMTAQGPTYYAWHRHALGSARIVESITAGPSTGGNLDALTMVTNQPAAADPQANIRHVEVLTDALDELTPLAQAWYLDDAVNPSSAVSSNTPILPGAPYGGLTLNGLWHLNGKTVSVFASGLDCGDYAVANGSIFVPYGDSISAGAGGGLFTATYVAANPQIVVGFTYNCDGQLVRPQAPQDAGTRTGPALGKRRRFHKVAMLLSNLAMGNARNQSALLIGRDFAHLTPVIISPQTVPNQPQMLPGQVFSGVWMDAVQSESNYDGQVCWRIARPLSGTIVAIEPILEGQD